jgi:hypothetical protein
VASANSNAASVPRNRRTWKAHAGPHRRGGAENQPARREFGNRPLVLMVGGTTDRGWRGAEKMASKMPAAPTNVLWRLYWRHGRAPRRCDTA